LGLITSKFAEVEDIEEMKKKVYAAADLMAKGESGTREQALKQLGVSPQCGFASHHEGNAVQYEDMVNKLTLVKKLAEAVWPGEA
jgi:methionine synthase II (cobalamin-independent)